VDSIEQRLVTSFAVARRVHLAAPNYGSDGDAANQG
jgi:hypothetical protein